MLDSLDCVLAAVVLDLIYVGVIPKGVDVSHLLRGVGVLSSLDQPHCIHVWGCSGEAVGVKSRQICGKRPVIGPVHVEGLHCCSVRLLEDHPGHATGGSVAEVDQRVLQVVGAGHALIKGHLLVVISQILDLVVVLVNVEVARSCAEVLVSYNIVRDENRMEHDSAI